MKTYNNLFDYATKADMVTTSLTITDSTKVIKNLSQKYKELDSNEKLPSSGVDSLIDLSYN